MSLLGTAILIIVLSYASGCVSGAYYVVKHFTGKDIRKTGSGNAGATNAGRMLGKKGFLLVLAVDAGKGLAALSITDWLSGGNKALILVSAFSVLIGHLFPAQLQFQGGKGVVVYLAASLYLAPATIAFMAIIMLVSYLALRRYTLAGFLAMGSIPVTSWWLGYPTLSAAGLAFLFIIVAAAHKK
jgi:acyl phosphate:glycerol-3-phosphate acyltransferase